MYPLSPPLGSRGGGWLLLPHPPLLGVADPGDTKGPEGTLPTFEPIKTAGVKYTGVLGIGDT